MQLFLQLFNTFRHNKKNIKIIIFKKYIKVILVILESDESNEIVFNINLIHRYLSDIYKLFINKILKCKHIICPLSRPKGPVVGAGALFDASAPIYIVIFYIAKI